MTRVDTDELIKKYGDRRAFEWFVRAEDKRHLNIAERMIREEREEVMAALKKREATIVILTITLHLILVLYVRTLLFRSWKILRE